MKDDDDSEAEYKLLETLSTRPDLSITNLSWSLQGTSEEGVLIRENQFHERFSREYAAHQLRSEIRLVAVLSIPGTSPPSSPRSDPSLLSTRLCVRPYRIGGEPGVLAARVLKDKGHGRPSFVELDQETDLNVTPPGWLICETTTNARSSPSGVASENLAVVGATSHLSGALADLKMAAQEEPADFISSSNTMKTIFKLPFSSASVSLAVHRVDNSLILNGLINSELDAGDVKAPETASVPSTDRGSRRRRKNPANSLFNKFMYYSVSGADGVEPLIESELDEGMVREERRETDPAAEACGRIFRRAIHFQFHHLG